MKLERAKPELTFNTSCASSPAPSILAIGLGAGSCSSLLYLGAGRMLVRGAEIEVMVGNADAVEQDTVMELYSRQYK